MYIYIFQIEEPPDKANVLNSEVNCSKNRSWENNKTM